ncbi:MAG: DUF4213 domain-containing protein [Desulfobacula sp.]
MTMILDRVCGFLNREVRENPEIREIVINPNFTGVLLENNDMGMAMNIRKGSDHDAESYIDIEKIIGLGEK